MELPSQEVLIFTKQIRHWILSSMNTFFKSYNLDLIGF